MTIDTEQDTKRRTLLRTVLTTLDALDDEVPPSGGFMEASLAVERAIEALKDGFDMDYAATCEGCGFIVLYGDKGHRCREGEILCADCAVTWGEIKEQMDDPGYLEDEPGDRDQFLKNYQAHLDGGGSATDKVLHTI